MQENISTIRIPLTPFVRFCNSKKYAVKNKIPLYKTYFGLEM